MTETSQKKNLAAVIVILFVLCVCTYSTILSNQFLSFDDGHYIVDNLYVKRGVTIDNVRWAFNFLNKSGSYWHPLTWLSLMLDYQLVGLNPSWFHLVNLLLHTTSVVILFLVLHGMTGSVARSAMVSALFAIHPLNVESVAWAAERKTVLSGLFFMLTLLSYVYYAKRPGFKRYLMISIFFALGLMAKSMIVSLPFVMLLLDVWPMRRVSWGVDGKITDNSFMAATPLHLVLEKIPLVLLSLASVTLSILSLYGSNPFDERNLLPLSHKLANAAVSLWFYIVKLLWPANLAVYYPVRLGIPGWQVVLAVAFLMLVSVVAIVRLRKSPWLLVGWIWYLAALLPVSGIIRRGLWPAMADRFAYLPMIGLLIAAVWIGADLGCRIGIGRSVKLCCAALLVLGMAAVCRRQVSFWHDSGTLFQRAVEVTENNDIALANLGWYRFSDGRQQEALQLFSQAALIDSSKPDFEYANGAIAFNSHHYNNAAQWFDKALARNNKHLASLFFLGLSRERSGDYEGAAHAYLQLTDTDGLDPNDYRGKGGYRLRYNIHPILQPRIKVLAAEATVHPGERIARERLADALLDFGMLDEALRQYEMLAGNENDYSANVKMADIFRRKGDSVKAEKLFQSDLLRDGKDCIAALGLGRIYMQQGRWESATALFASLEQRGVDCPDVSFNRALSLYASGRWGDALAQFRKVFERYPSLQFATTRYITKLDQF